MQSCGLAAFLLQNPLHAGLEDRDRNGPAQERFAQEQGVKPWSKLLEDQHEVQATLHRPTKSSAHAWRSTAALAHAADKAHQCAGFDDQGLLALLSHFVSIAMSCSYSLVARGAQEPSNAPSTGDSCP